VASSKQSRRAERPADDAVELRLLTPLCELMVIITQAGQRLNPPLVPPPSLKPFLKFTHKLPVPGLRAVRKVIDSDADWRNRLAIAATEPLVGECGVLYVTRPDGWEARFAELLAEQRSAGDASHEGRLVREMERQRDLADQRVLALRQDLVEVKATNEARTGQLRVETDRALSDLSTERGLRARIEQEAAKSALLAATAVAAQARLEAELDLVKAHLLLASSEIAALTERVSELAGRSAVSVPSANVGVLVESVSAAFEILGLRLGELNAATAGEAAVDQPASRKRAVGPTASKAQRAEAQRTLNPSLRSPQTLPPATSADSTAAADHLVRSKPSLLLVDGYNLAKTIWPSPTLRPVELRERVVALVGQVSSRTRQRFTLVFDGVAAGEHVVSPVLTSAHRKGSVRILFSPESKEADAVISELVAHEPVKNAVLVVSSDRRVQRLCESMGANVISSQQFQAAFG
jgi:predicted RNA-binding protein with PIN domain